MSNKEYEEFMVFYLEDDGTYKRVEDITQETLGKSLHDEEVLLIVREDMHRLYIWKGPKSPVRKRFISSKTAAGIQEEYRKNGGRHLKIVSIDAGEEPVEFLAAFDLKPYQVSGVLEDMKYIRNIDREKAKQEALQKELNEAKKLKESQYVSPLEKEMIQSLDSESEKMVKQNVPSVAQKENQPIEKLYPSPKKQKSIEETKTQVSLDKQQRLLSDILKINPPEGYHRMNIIIGPYLYASNTTKSYVLGKLIEKQDWNQVTDIPIGLVDLNMEKIRIHIDEELRIIKAIELFEKNNEDSEDSEDSEKNQQPKKPQKRSLPKIPEA
jgi:hypothetical protein